MIIHFLHQAGALGSNAVGVERLHEVILVRLRLLLDDDVRLHRAGLGLVRLRDLALLILHAGHDQQLKLFGNPGFMIQLHLENTAGLSPVRTGQVFRHASAT